jgi:hypothetical protein
MPNPHYNYYPPAGQIIDASDSRVTWNGRAWMLNGRVYGVPANHRLIGRAGGPLAGWYYDWSRHAWMDNAPSAQPPRPVAPLAAPPPAPRPAARPAPRPAPRPPVVVQPTIQTQAPAPKQPEKTEMVTMEKPHNALDALIKHPIAPLIGGVLLLAAQFTDEPAPPAIPTDLPEPVAKQWQMIFNQNQQRFQRRMDLYENLGMVLLGYASTNAVLAALPARKAA